MSGETRPVRGSVAEMLSRAVAMDRDRTALLERDASTSYRDLLERAGAVAGRLTSAGVTPGDRVVVLLERGADAVASYFGVLAAGGIAVMLNEMLRPRQIEYALDHSGAAAFLSSGAIRARHHRNINTAIVTIDVEDVPASGSFEPVPRAGDDPAQITYTSGSTGMPKGVVGTHGNIWCVIESVAGYLGLKPDDRLSGMLPISGVYGANQMLCSVHMGATLVVPKSPIMNQVASELREAGATVLAAVPPLWLQLLKAPGFAAEPIPSLRILQNAGGHLPPSVVQQLRKAQPQAHIFLQYGLTEVFRSTFLPPEEVDRRPGSMGIPMPGCEVLVVRDDNTLCGPDEVGELVHCGPSVTAGYWNDEDRTAEVYRPHPVPGREGRVVYSGDMVRRDAEGFLYFVGRRDRMIKTLGYRVGPDEVLDVLYASGQIVEGAVIAAEDAERGQRIVAYVVLTEAGSIKALTGFCRAELPRYMQPNEFRVLTELPRLPNGKHDLLALKTMEGSSP